MKWLIVLIVFLTGTICGSATTIYVPDNYPTIQGAINVAVNGDTVIVRQGTYVENIDFLGKAVTVRSEMGAVATTIDGHSASYSVVSFSSGEGRDSVLDGFTITNAEAGGIYCNGSWPTIKNNTITGNGEYFYGGGGIACTNSSPMITNNIITENHSDSDCGGGGIHCKSNSSPTITNNTITGNVAWWPAKGGGICCAGSSPTITNNIITENLSDWGGGGIHCYHSSPTIMNNSITGNCTNGGGGINCDYSSPLISNNIIRANEAGIGGGIHCYHSSPTITNNTVTKNTANNGQGGGFSCLFSSPTIANTILWDNMAAIGKEISIGDSNSPSTLNISYSDVDGGQSSIHVEPGCTLNWGAGMIDADPVFADPADDDFHLTWNSPCRDSGDNSVATDTYDFEGDPRIALGKADMGADEYYYHLYHSGDIVPGNPIDLKVVGAPTLPVTLFLGSGFQDPPFDTQHGYFGLTWPPLWHGGIGSIPGNGILVQTATVPTGWASSGPYPLQALVGSWGHPYTHLTNLLDGDPYEPPGPSVVYVPDDKPTIQEAIEYVSEGGVVIVRPGTYVENIDFLGKAITVKSELGPTVTIIDGNQAGSVVSMHSFDEKSASVLDGFTITNGSADYGGGIYCEVSPCSPTIDIINNIISNNSARETGGGVNFIGFYSSTSRISNNTISNNSGIHGGGVYCGGTSPMISNNAISYNSASYGGGVRCDAYSSIVTNNIISNNTALKGGGIFCWGESSPTITNNTIFGNLATDEGGGISTMHYAAAVISNTILWENDAPYGPEIYLDSLWGATTVEISYSDVDGGQFSVHVDPGSTLNWGSGMFDADPLFVIGPKGDYYLSQIAAGQTLDSPCVDTCDPASDMIIGTTRTDEVQDSGVVDMGYHHPLP